MPQRKQKELYPTRVQQKKEISPGVIVLETERPFNFVPGQVVAVALSQNEEPRLYSIASGADSKTIRLLFDVNPIGLLTPRLAKLNEGASLLMSAPFGRFTGTGEPAWWIATGTGIAPFISMTESGLHTHKTLIHGARRADEFWFSDFFKKELNGSYLRFATRDTGPGINSGRLTQWLKEQDGLPGNLMYYICGNANMVTEVRDILVQKKVPFENIVAEIYF